MLGALPLARRAGRVVLAGPCLLEVGFEQLYWIPLLRHLLERHRIPPERVVAISRGGCEAWYGDIAARYVDVYDVMGADELQARLSERRARAGDQKQIGIAALDRDLLARVAARLGGERTTVVHPTAMHALLRRHWDGRRPVAGLARRVRWAALDRRRHADAFPDLGGPYIAFKPYTSDSFPDTPSNRALVEALAARLGERRRVVVLGHGLPGDGHVQIPVPDDSGAVETAPAMTLRDQLGAQSALIAGADALVSTYGGMSYVAMFLGVPALGLYSTPAFNPAHVEAARHARAAIGGEAPLELLGVGGNSSLEAAITALEAIAPSTGAPGFV